MQWKIKNQKSTKKVDWIIERLLENRGIGKKDREEFLQKPEKVPTRQLMALFNQSELKKVTSRIKEAIAKNWPIVIHGDYDVDGLCGTAILWEAIYYGLNYQNVYPFIPHRIDHGYGLSKISLEEIAASDYLNFSNSPKKLLITVDCGITAVNEVDFAKELGFEVLILDHHVKPESLPPAEVILHTTDLCATGIAYTLASNLCPLTSHFSLLTSHLELVALAIIADLQPLLGLNRRLVQLGLKELNQTQCLGLQELIKIACIENRTIGPYEVGFVLAPRLNAMGRLEHALESLRLLCTQDRIQAQELARKLNQVNAQRQRLTDEALQIAKQKLSTGEISKEITPIVLAHPGWHEGVIGLIAAKLVEEFNRPAIIISQGEKFSKASARSISGFNIIEELRVHQENLVELGGHEMAAGFTIETEKIDEFGQKFIESSLPALLKKDLTPVLKIDLELDPAQISWELISTLKRLEPYGLGNPRPIFLTRNLKIDDLKWVGSKSNHLKLTLSQAGQEQKFFAIGFGLAEKFGSLTPTNSIDLVYTLEENEFNGLKEIQLRIKDLKIIPNS